MRSLKHVFISCLAAALCWGTTAFGADSSAATSPTIVFVCEHGNVKSVMAAAYFNQIAREKGLPFVATARGLAPDADAVPAAIAAGLRQQGHEVGDFHPLKLSTEDLSTARQVIAISLPASAPIRHSSTAMVTWDDVPAASENFNAASAAIKAHVDALVARLYNARQ